MRALYVVPITLEKRAVLPSTCLSPMCGAAFAPQGGGAADTTRRAGDDHHAVGPCVLRARPAARREAPARYAPSPCLSECHLAHAWCRCRDETASLLCSTRSGHVRFHEESRSCSKSNARLIHLGFVVPALCCVLFCFVLSPSCVPSCVEHLPLRHWRASVHLSAPLHAL